MEKVEVVVIGASAGGVGALQRVVEHIPQTFGAAIFVTLHLPDGVRSMLPEILTRAGHLPAALAVNGEPIEAGRIYVAPAGFHLTIEPGLVRVTRGAREHAHRPAIDPLFRSAAVAYGPRAIGVILSGLLDDGTAGLVELKRAGGIAVVQEPSDTEWPSMPQSAINHVAVDYIKPASELGDLLTRLVMADDPPSQPPSDTEDMLAAEELKELTAYEADAQHPGTPSPYACPECGGVLWELNNDELLRFRCRVGHAYSTEALTMEQSLAAENALWTALRALEEQAAIRRRMASRARRNGRVQVAATYEESARDLELQARQVRALLLSGVGAAVPESTPPH